MAKKGLVNKGVVKKGGVKKGKKSRKDKGEIPYMQLVVNVLRWIGWMAIDKYHTYRRAHPKIKTIQTENDFHTCKCRYNYYGSKKSNKRELKEGNLTIGKTWTETLDMLERYLQTPNWEEILTQLSKKNDKSSRKIHAILKTLAGEAVEDAGEDEAAEDEDQPDPSNRRPPRQREIVAVDDEVHPIGPIVTRSGLSARLKPYQQKGVDKILTAFQNHNGALLADEMGGGKTLQALAVCDRLQSGAANGFRVLIISPKSVLETWVAESKEFNTQPIVKYQSIATVQSHPFVVISDSIIDDQHEVLAKEKFDVIIVDEAHRMKNSKKKMYSAVLKLDSSKKLLITGTPVPNTLSDLHSLIKMVASKLAGETSDFDTRYKDVIERGRLRDASFREKKAGRIAENELRTRFKPVIVRRTGLIDLPVDKYESIVIVEPTPQQIAAMKILSTIHTEQTESTLLPRTSDMQLIGLHPSYLTDVRRAAMNMGVKRKLKVATLTEDDIAPSAKLRVCCDIIRDSIDKKEKIVVCSKVCRSLDLFGKLCEKVFKVPFFRLDGDTSETKRVARIKSFNSTEDKTPVFLLSSAAGGCGIKLIGASRLIMYDVDFTPANDYQAMARIYRHGQDKACHIIRLVEAGGVEETLLRLQDYKNSVGGSIIGDNPQPILFGDDDIKLSLEHQYGHLPIVSEAHSRMQCTRCSDGVQKKNPPLVKNMSLDSYHHFTSKTKHLMEDTVVKDVWTDNSPIIFTFSRKLSGIETID